MNSEIRQLLEAVKAGEVSVDDALMQIKKEPFADLGYAKVGSVPVMLICLLVVFPFFYFGVHRTVSGRRLFATGANITAARYSGIRTDKIKVLMFTLNGVLAAVGGIFLAARTGSGRFAAVSAFVMGAQPMPSAMSVSACAATT